MDPAIPYAISRASNPRWRRLEQAERLALSGNMGALLEPKKQATLLGRDTNTMEVPSCLGRAEIASIEKTV